MRAWRGHPGEEKSGTRATRSFYASGITPAAKTGPRGGAAGVTAGKRLARGYVETPALHRLPEKKRRAILRPYVWRRSWAQRRQHFLIQRRESGSALCP